VNHRPLAKFEVNEQFANLFAKAVYILPAFGDINRTTKRNLFEKQHSFVLLATTTP
jgi:hypothetical protein